MLHIFTSVTCPPVAHKKPIPAFCSLIGHQELSLEKSGNQTGFQDTLHHDSSAASEIGLLLVVGS